MPSTFRNPICTGTLLLGLGCGEREGVRLGDVSLVAKVRITVPVFTVCCGARCRGDGLTSEGTEGYQVKHPKSKNLKSKILQGL